MLPPENRERQRASELLNGSALHFASVSAMKKHVMGVLFLLAGCAFGYLGGRGKHAAARRAALSADDAHDAAPCA